MKVFGNISRKSLASVVLPLDEQPERPTMIALRSPIMREEIVKGRLSVD